MIPEKIALEARLKGCKNIKTLGVFPNFGDYPPGDIKLIQNAKKIYYPTSFYAELFDIAGKKTFPSYHTYKCAQDKIKQTALFNILNIPHPKTRVFYGKRQKSSVLQYFTLPFIGKIPRGSALGKGVYLIKNREDLENYFSITNIAYIQEYLPSDRDIRIVVIGEKIAHAYWRVAPEGEFRSNVAVGADILLDPVPGEAKKIALLTAQKCRWDDVGIDIIKYGSKYYVLEANMKYGKEGFRKSGIDYMKLMETMIENGEI